MSSKRKKRQSRLVFDPIGPSSRIMSPARIRYADPNARNQKKFYESKSTLDDGNVSEGTYPDESSVVAHSLEEKNEIGVELLPSPQKSSQLSTKGLDTAGMIGFKHLHLFFCLMPNH